MARARGAGVALFAVALLGGGLAAGCVIFTGGAEDYKLPFDAGLDVDLATLAEAGFGGLDGAITPVADAGQQADAGALPDAAPLPPPDGG